MRSPRFFPTALLLLLFAPLSPATASAQLRPEARQQIQALLAEKASRTPVQHKLGSRLLHETRMWRGLAVADGVREQRTGVEVDRRGAALVDLRGEITPRLLARIEGLGGEVLGTWPGRRALRAWIPLEGCESIAALPEVDRLRPAARAYTNADVSQGVVAHKVDLARSAKGVDGTGVSVAALSDGVDALASLQLSGDLPAVTVLPGQAGSGTEGTAMLEIVFDVAPGADLSFATAFGGIPAFASNILALRDAGADIIVDDVRYFSEPVFQAGEIAAAVDQVVADGGMYFSSAGNEGNLGSGTSGVWEGDFVDSGALEQGSPAHDFGGGVTGNRISADSPFVFTLQWSDPQGASANDYDLFLFDSSQTFVLSSSTDGQNGNDDPYEIIDSRAVNHTNDRLVVVLFAGEPRYLHVNAFRGEFQEATTGQVSGHTGAKGAVSVAATDVRSASGPGGTFSGFESIQSFSSDGLRRIFYLANGEPITQSLLSDGGLLLQKPQLTAADCVDTATPGFNTFCGTSAAAPHAAGIAAVLLELARPRGLGPDEVLGAMFESSLDIESPGVDLDSGYGIIDALGASGSVLLLPPNLPSLGPAGLGLLVASLGLAGLLSRRGAAAGFRAACRRRRRG